MDGEPVVVRLAPAEVAAMARAVTAGLASLGASGRRPTRVSWEAVRQGPQGWHLDVGQLDLATGALGADDVRDWAAALLARCPADSPALLLRVLRTCQAERPGARPDAAELARLVAAATRPPPRRRRPPWRWLALLAVVGIGIPAAWGAGQALLPELPQPSSPTVTAASHPAPAAAPRRPSPASPSPVADPPPVRRSTPAPATPEPKWTAVLAGLDRARAAWWADPREADLAAGDVRGSAAWRADRAVVARLRAAGLHAEGGGAVVDSVREVARGTSWVLLRVVDRRSGYRLVDTAGRVRERVAARGPVVWQVRLAQVEGRWRVERVSRMTVAASPTARQGPPAAPARTSGAPR